jgi:hypothetical protein
MIELKRELETLVDQWHNYIGGGTMTNKEHATQLREIIARYDSEPQESEIAMGVLEPLTKEAADTLLKALSSNHRFTESSDPSE